MSHSAAYAPEVLEVFSQGLPFEIFVIDYELPVFKNWYQATKKIGGWHLAGEQGQPPVYKAGSIDEMIDFIGQFYGHPRRRK